MTKHKSAGGTQGQPKPMSSAQAAKHLSPGPKFPGMRAERASHGNIYNDNPDGKRAWNKLTPGLIKDVRKT